MSTALIATIAISGEIDIATAPGWFELGQALIENCGPGTVCFDLAAVTFMDPVGLGMLVALRNLAGNNGNTIIITNVPCRVQKLLALTGLDFAAV